MDSSLSRDPAATLNLSDPSFWQLPRTELFGAFDSLRAARPVSWQPPPAPWAPRGERPPRGYWAVTSYAGVRAVSRDPDTFSSAEGVMLFDNLSPGARLLNDGWVGMDAPEHTRLRRLVSGAFTPKMVRRFATWVRDEAQVLIEAVAPRGECDFFSDLAAPLPVAVICTLLGVPPSERAEVMRLTHAGVHFSSDVPFEETLAAVAAVVEYATDLSRRRRVEPGDDLISALVSAEAGHGLSDAEVATTFWVLITGGSDTTSTTAAHGMIALSSFPDERARWQGEYETLAPTAVEEMLRWATPVLCFRRTATRDTTVLGEKVAAGENVVMFYKSANRDEAAFDHPYRFQVGRQPNPHVAFGAGGPHFCVGAALARLQLTVLFRQLFLLLPDIQLSGEPSYVAGPFLDTVAAVPCRFTPHRVTSR